jgi:hypothetical protein
VRHSPLRLEEIFASHFSSRLTLNAKLNFLISTAPAARRLISTFECIARSVGFPLRPGHVAYGDGRNASAYPPDRAMHFINITTIFTVRRICGSDRRLRRCRKRLRDMSGQRRNADRISGAHKRRSKSSAPKEQVIKLGSDPAKPNKIKGSVGSDTIFSNI